MPSREARYLALRPSPALGYLLVWIGRYVPMYNVGGGTQLASRSDADTYVPIEQLPTVQSRRGSTREGIASYHGSKRTE